MGKNEMAGGNNYRVKSFKTQFGVVMMSTHIHNELTVVPLQFLT